MKNSGFFKLSVAMLVAVIALFNFTSAMAQEEPDSSMNKTIKIKMITKNGGETKVFDTTLHRSGKLMDEEMSELMKELNLEMSDLSREMEDVNMEIEIPELPDIESMMKDYGDCFNFRGAFPHHRMVPFGGNEQGGLNELLGDIPLERVTSYSVKERKNGKRIVIDIENGPSVDKRKEMIIIQKGAKPKKVKMIRGKPVDSSYSTI